MSRSILITGGTGSIGRAVVEQCLQGDEFDKIAVFSRGEEKQQAMKRELGPDKRLRFFIGDIRDYQRLLEATRDFRYIVHCAALKHVDIVEYNPYEGIQTNIIGTQNVIRAATENRVETVTACGTDKSAAPMNLYGASKLCSDRLILSAAKNMSPDTGFTVVRFGNIFGSSGSVVEYFHTLAKQGKPLPVSDPDCTRYFASRECAASLLLVSLHFTSGKLYFPNLKAWRLGDLASLFGSPVEVAGLRLGDRKHETMLSLEEGVYAEKLNESGSLWAVDYYKTPGLPFEMTSDKAERATKSEIQAELDKLFPGKELQ